MSAATLFVHHRRGVPLAEALAAFAAVGAEAVALLYSPQACHFARLSAGRLLDGTGQVLDLATVFEARVFNATAELRWLNDASGQGQHRAAILAESDLSAPLGWPSGERVGNVIETLAQTYLLWGEGMEPESLVAGWSLLATPRIGGLAVPVAGARTRGQRVLLKTVEYLTEADHGNVVIADERLCGLEVERG